MTRWRRLRPDDVAPLRRDPVDPAALAAAAPIVDDVRARGAAAVRAHAEHLGDLRPGDPLTFDRAALSQALGALDDRTSRLLQRTAARIREFAEAQRKALQWVDIAVPGGRASHVVVPVTAAGCYAPGGRYPLPSSVLMTAVTARVAGVERVWVASPRPGPITLAAAAVAGADGLLAVGGAQAIAALAFGADPVPPCDVVVGPGNRYVTAAKQLVAGRVAIDMLAGPSELVVLADGSADPGMVAADLLAQAEHDPEALPVLVSLDAALADAVDAEIERQLATLPTAATARAAIAHGFAVACRDLAEACGVCNRLAPEHLQVMLADPKPAVAKLRHYGALFIGANSAEVFGDYGAGPNHVLPTGGTARHTGGLSVLTFLRVRTWLQVTAPAALAADAAALARLEGLEGHARAAERRVP